MMLSGFRSRCTTPASCATLNPHATSRASRTAAAGASTPCRRKSARRLSPGSSSIARYNTSSSAPKSKMVTTWGCVSRDKAAASRSKRAAIERSLASAGFITFSATSRPSGACSAT